MAKNNFDKGKGISASKSNNFSEWYTEIIQKCELADLRSNVKGCLVFQPWSVLSMEKMYSIFSKKLESKSHKPYFFPTLIPESNLKKESDHVKGFTPEVFWVGEAGNEKLEEKYALRPTSETLFYQMFGLWIRSYKDLPFKTYQRANVFRYETKATRPFLRSREFHWIEAHCAHATKDDAMNQVHEDMETTKEVLGDVFGLPFIFFERPSWDKFAGADRTFAADVLNPDGKVVQQPSTHLLDQAFSKAFNVMFKDKSGKDNYAFITCYGPAISRIFASVIIVHGDDKGLRFPWDIAPVQIVIVPVKESDKVLKKCESIKNRLSKFYSVDLDISDRSFGEKANYWEMKGVPIRIDIGEKDLDSGNVTLFRRDLNTKENIPEKNVEKIISTISNEFTNNLIIQSSKIFDSRIEDVSNLKGLKKSIVSGKIARCNFCSVDKSGFKCAEIVEKESGATIRGTNLIKENAFGDKKCIVCGKKASDVVYVARQY